MSVVDIINSRQSTGISLEVLPPLKGNSIDQVFRTIDRLIEFDPQYINITTHHSEYVFKELPDGSYKRVAERKRPGTVATAAAIKHRYGIPVVPHILCNGFTREETEYALIDLNFLGITDLLLLRGDKPKTGVNVVDPTQMHAHATGLQMQVNDFNAGHFLDGVEMELQENPFSYGVACYPEKHEEAPNLESDLHWLKEKQKNGAGYAVSQMFFDNEKYFSFVQRCRAEGITIPIIPGLKPVTLPSQLSILPRIFSTEIPEAFASELRKCSTKEAATQVGIEWCTAQSRELIAAGVPLLHYYTLNATESVRQVIANVF